MSDVYAADEFEDLGGDFVDDEFEEPAPALAPVSDEARARAMGWKPLAEFKGDPRRWTDAATFIAHGEEELPILRDQNRRMSEKLARFEPEMETLRSTVTQQAAAIKRAETIARRADETGYNRAMAELKAKQREAVEVGDTAAYDMVQAQIDASLAARQAVEAEVVEETPPPAPQNDVWPETREFLSDNPWFQADAELRTAMINAHQATLALHPRLSRAAQYAKARALVVDAFPDRFDEQPATEPEDQPLAREPAPAPARQPPRQPARATVREPSAPQPQNGRRSVMDQIPEDERADVRNGWEKARRNDPDLPLGEYVSLYLDPKQDILALRAQRKKA